MKNNSYVTNLVNSVIVKRLLIEDTSGVFRFLLDL